MQKCAQQTEEMLFFYAKTTKGRNLIMQNAWNEHRGGTLANSVAIFLLYTFSIRILYNWKSTNLRKINFWALPFCSDAISPYQQSWQLCRHHPQGFQHPIQGDHDPYIWHAHGWQQNFAEYLRTRQSTQFHDSRNRVAIAILPASGRGIQCTTWFQNKWI